MEPKEMAEKVLNLVKSGNQADILLLFIENYDNERDVLTALLDVQNQLRKLGGDWPQVGKQIETMAEIIQFSQIAIGYALENRDKLTAGKLNHNVASCCFPNMDDGVDSKFIEPGYQAALADYKLRQDIGEKVPLLWAKWLLGVSEYIKGDVEVSITTLEDTAKIALEEPEDKGLAAWADMMKVKFQLKSGYISKEKAAKKINKIESVLTKLDDKYGLSTLKQIKEI